MTARELLAVHLECSGPGPWAQSARARVAAPLLGDAAEQWGGRLRVGSTQQDEVLALLGPADQSLPGRLRYALASRPHFWYELRFDATLVLVEAGFVRRSDLSPGSPGGRDLVKGPGPSCETLTEDQVLAQRGPPSEVQGWWPNTWWTWPDGSIVEFRHGVVEPPWIPAAEAAR